jgi:hypothetical protein
MKKQAENLLKILMVLVEAHLVTVMEDLADLADRVDTAVLIIDHNNISLDLYL